MRAAAERVSAAMVMHGECADAGLQAAQHEPPARVARRGCHERHRAGPILPAADSGFTTPPGSLALVAKHRPDACHSYMHTYRIVRRKRWAQPGRRISQVSTRSGAG